jgi:pimeloyl-ACP methyl ester carboxylesterase
MHSSCFRNMLILYLCLESWGCNLFQCGIDELEDLMMEKLYGQHMSSHWISVAVDNEVWKTHYIRTKNEFISKDKSNILLLHGYGATSALTWRVTIPKLIDKYNIFSIDMPGFGRSPASNTLLSPDTSPQEVQDMFCNFYSEMLKHFNISSPLVIAHSFGGFIYIPCVANNPNLASKLVLIAVPGYFSSGGTFGYYCSSYFSFGMPHSVIKLLGDVAHYLYDLAQFVIGNIDSVLVRYWHLVHMSDAMAADKVVGKFIDHRLAYSFGRPVLVPFLNLSVPVATVYGSEDVIAPPHQGELLQELSGIPSYVIQGGSHVAYTHNSGRDFVQVSDGMGYITG